MTQFIPSTKRESLQYVGLLLLWLAAYKSADVFNFFETYSSLWFLPAGVTLSIALAAPMGFITAPLIANLLLAIPAVCALSGIEFTGYRDPILHSFRLFAIYAGAGLIARFGLKLVLPISDLKDQLALITITMIAAGLGALSGVSLHAAVGNFPWFVAWDILLPWATGDAIGALIVPPLLVPILLRLLGDQTSIGLPSWQNLGFQSVTILLAMFVAFAVPKSGPNLGPLAYVILLPPIVFAVRGGIPAAATAITLTTLLTPPAATWLGFEGERISLQFLLLISAVAALMIGGAITDRQRAFQRIKHSEEHLDQQVRDRTQELREAYEFQQHLMRSIGHDLRQPVQSLNMMLDGLAIQHKGTPLVEPVEQARNIGKTADGFIGKILDYAKRDAGRVDVNCEEFSVQRVFDQVAQTFGPHAETSGINLVIQPTDLFLNTDAHLLWEALSNLVQNSVRLSRMGQTVTLNAKLAGDAVEITVVDQVEDNSRVSGQAGFGLEIVKQIARLLRAEFQRTPNLASLKLPN